MKYRENELGTVVDAFQLTNYNYKRSHDAEEWKNAPDWFKKAMSDGDIFVDNVGFLSVKYNDVEGYGYNVLCESRDYILKYDMADGTPLYTVMHEHDFEQNYTPLED